MDCLFFKVKETKHEIEMYVCIKEFLCEWREQFMWLSVSDSLQLHWTSGTESDQYWIWMFYTWKKARECAEGLLGAMKA